MAEQKASEFSGPGKVMAAVAVASAVEKKVPSAAATWTVQHQHQREEVVADMISYPHPSFPSPDAPTVATVASAKAKLIDIISSSKAYSRAIQQIAIQPTIVHRFALLRVDKTGTSMIAESLSTYSLVNHETAWPELLERVYQSLGQIGTSHGNILVSREQECASIQLMWN